MKTVCWAVICLLLLVAPRARSVSKDIKKVTWDNFGSVQEGEWMIEFFAHWCPACQQFSSTWDSFAEHMADTYPDLTVGHVDIGAETMLSGRFMVTHLPSIFHVINGEVRQYEGDRSLSDLIDYVKDSRWEKTTPIPTWKSPTAPHMYLVGSVFWLSERAREIQAVLENDYQMPTYAIFILVAVATIVFGLLLGGVTVCLIEVCLRLCSKKKEEVERRPPSQPQKKQEQPSSTQPASKGTGKSTSSGKGGSGGKAGGEVRKRNKGGGGKQ